MNLLTSIIVRAEEGHLVTDDKGVVTHSWIWPEKAELIYGTISSLLVFGLLFKVALPLAKKAMAERTAKIQKELDDSADAKSAADAEAAQIRAAKGDIDGERARLLAEADAEAERLLADGRVRLDQEIADLHTKADQEIAQLAARSGGELRNEIAGLSSEATEQLVRNSLDPDTQSALIEDFIAKVGAAR